MDKGERGVPRTYTGRVFLVTDNTVVIVTFALIQVRVYKGIQKI